MSKTSDLHTARAERKRLFMPKTEAAKRRKVSRRTVQNWCQRGIIPTDERGRILRREFDRLWPRKFSVYEA